METRETLYKTYVNAQKDNLSNVALYTREGEAVTHQRLLEEADKAAAGLLMYKKEDSFKIGIISSSSYEEAVFLLAASKIGAVSKFIDFTKNMTEIYESLVESSVNVLVMGAEFLPMEQFINPTGLPVIVMGDAPLNRPNYCAYLDLLNKSGDLSLSPVEYRDNTCAIIINSSGTTGTPKPIELSDHAINIAVAKHINSDLPLSSSNIMLKIIPSFLGMGVISTLYTCLIAGIPVIYFVAYGPNGSIDGAISMILSYPQFARKHHIPSSAKLLIFASPMFFRGVYQMINHVDDLSYFGCLLAGGSAMSKEELETIDAAFASKGCTVPVLIGYGQNEMAGGVTMNEIGANKSGSAGKPMAYTEILIVDMESGKPVPNHTIGKILERSESLFIGYENMPERTASSFVADEKGDLWFDTNDVGFMDDDGFMYISGRTSRIIIRFDMKVSLDKIEDKIRMSKYVKEAGVISIKDSIYGTTIAFVVLKEEYRDVSVSLDMIVADIQQSRNPLNDREHPDQLIIVDALPYRSSGKIDYLALEKMAEEILHD